MTQAEIEAIAKAHEDGIAGYKRLAELVADHLRSGCQAHGLSPDVTPRAKDLRSTINKCRRHGGPIGLVKDLAGVKVVVRYQEEVRQICTIIQDVFDAQEPDVKVDAYEPNELGYLATHLHVRLKPEMIDADSSALSALECEIIVHTGVETAWDSISHQIMYKPYVDLPKESKRTLIRLLALVELFDKEVTSVRAEYVSNPEYQSARVLDILEKYYVRVDPHVFNRSQSISVIDALVPLLPKEKVDTLDDEMNQFVYENRDSLKTAFSLYPNPTDVRSVFLHQPETLLMFAMFDWGMNDAVRRAWVGLFPQTYLSEIAAAWAVTL